MGSSVVTFCLVLSVKLRVDDVDFTHFSAVLLSGKSVDCVF